MPTLPLGIGKKIQGDPEAHWRLECPGHKRSARRARSRLQLRGAGLQNIAWCAPGSACDVRSACALGLELSDRCLDGPVPHGQQRAVGFKLVAAVVAACIRSRIMEYYPRGLQVLFGKATAIPPAHQHSFRDGAALFQGPWGNPMVIAQKWLPFSGVGTDSRS